MNDIEKKMDAVIRMITTDDPSERESIRNEIRTLMKKTEPCKRSVSADPETEVRQILLDVGAPDHLVGHAYVIQAVLLVLQDRFYINHMTKGLYPKIAVMHDTTASRVDRGIRHLIETAWERGDYDILCSYFGNIVSPQKGRPTNSEFIARVTNIVKIRMSDSAA